MALYKLAFNNESGRGAFQFVVSLEDRLFTFQFRWNTRSSAWYMNVLDADQNILVSGHKVVANWSLLSRYRDVRLPAGRVWCICLATGIIPTVENFGTDVILVFEEAA